MVDDVRNDLWMKEKLTDGRLNARLTSLPMKISWRRSLSRKSDWQDPSA